MYAVLFIFHVTAFVLCIITNQGQKHVELDDQYENIKKELLPLGLIPTFSIQLNTF